AEKFKGRICSPAHRYNMLNIIRGQLYVADIIYANGNRFLCSTSLAPAEPYIIPAAEYTRSPDISNYYYRDTPFYAGYKMVYMQRGHYAIVVNPLAYSEVMSDDPSLAYGLYDTITKAFFSVSPTADARVLAGLIQNNDFTFQHAGRYLQRSLFPVSLSPGDAHPAAGDDLQHHYFANVVPNPSGN
ncbi:MAG: hypothetical protein K0S90_267, partial [Enterobacteriaceae bacterium]|nr:hypothetical protein [Enterobacteriaceae bacterium]